LWYWRWRELGSRLAVMFELVMVRLDERARRLYLGAAGAGGGVRGGLAPVAATSSRCCCPNGVRDRNVVPA